MTMSSGANRVDKLTVIPRHILEAGVRRLHVDGGLETASARTRDVLSAC
jgi:hypothetical protein